MQYLIDRGIDMTIEDYRWNANAIGWARYGKSDEKMAQWLEEAERKRGGSWSGKTERRILFAVRVAGRCNPTAGRKLYRHPREREDASSAGTSSPYGF
jgi:hypothetical protein